MFAARCRGEAFARLGMNACMPVMANASPLRFQKTKVFHKYRLAQEIPFKFYLIYIIVQRVFSTRLARGMKCVSFLLLTGLSGR
ncbi:hypothetical protein KsCSTR_10750 [Candidatus Kuenenia stuttgartiensis]|uniref:Uncharacterized protein n=1 Tax=Kuenenia stuttgartiensis TaxID=174633 RepID=Q1PYL9_KUEST|nr:hypothetical protein KsCSTR_10750 [Candidatus Kuenenia stuttgartiensis]CAJ72186.1 unknown protein [Candidatus Kuenenia stuttgartiensis]